jgi:hypothetical protein
MSPPFVQLPSLDAEPYIQHMYNTPSSSSQSPCIPQLFNGTDSTLEAYLKQDLATSLDPSSTSPKESWDKYIAWDSLRSPIFSQSSWSLQTTQGSPSAPLFSEFSDPWKPLEPPDPSSPTGEFERPNLPSRSAASTFDLSQRSFAPDSGFISRPTSYSANSNSLSPAQSSTNSPTNPRVRSPSRRKPKKTKSAAHNDVEKRYRSKLNAKIAELSASVPNARSETTSENASNDEMDVEPRSGCPSRGLKKATILSRATAYIRLLEGELKKLEAENVRLKKRLALCGRIAVEEESK